MSRVYRAFSFACVSTVLLGLILGSTAWAGPIIDKGDLGKYERKGRLVFRILTPPARNTDMSAQPQYRADGPVIVDRGPYGVWHREGRILRRQYTGGSDKLSTAPRYNPRPFRVVNHIKHKHMLPN